MFTINILLSLIQEAFSTVGGYRNVHLVLVTSTGMCGLPMNSELGDIVLVVDRGRQVLTKTYIMCKQHRNSPKHQNIKQLEPQQKYRLERSEI